MPASSNLADFLAENKADYLRSIRSANGADPNWTVVMGNEACDLDSLASSIAYSYVQTKVHQKPTVAFIPSEPEDLNLRAENRHALSLAGVIDYKQSLLFASDLRTFKPFPSTRFALTDHNRLGSDYAADNPSAQVEAIYDHHEDEGLHVDTTKNARIISPAGSCSSHIATSLCTPDIPGELATLLLCAVLVDTDGLKAGGKALDVDHAAAAFLSSKSNLLHGQSNMTSQSEAVKALNDELSSKKADVSHLSARDLLRRDYKEYTYDLRWSTSSQTTLKAGLSTVPLKLQVWGSDGQLERSGIDWMRERHLDVLGVLTTYSDASSGKHKRQMAWIVAPQEESLTDHVCDRLWKGLENSNELRAELHDKFSFSDRVPGRIYKQKNAKATRKAVAPLLKNLIENTS